MSPNRVVVLFTPLFAPPLAGLVANLTAGPEQSSVATVRRNTPKRYAGENAAPPRVPGTLRVAPQIIRAECSRRGPSM
jgi:hypothetical protein